MSPTSRSAMQLEDGHARSQAIDPGGSYAVSAPAGSGKTELLIQRTLSLLARVEQPESILGITFTRKAANEMRERVVKALARARINEPPESAHEQAARQLALAALDRSDKSGWNLLENPGRLGFQTIDGLCRQLANQLCLETGIVVPTSISEDPGALYHRAAAKTLDFIDDKGPVGEALRLLVAHLDGNLEKLVELIADLLANRESWLPIITPGDIDQSYLQERVEALIKESLFKVGDVLAGYSDDIESLLGYALLHREIAGQLHPDTTHVIPEPEPSELPGWKALSAFLLTGRGSYRRRVTVANGFPTESAHATRAEAKARKARFAGLIAMLEQDGQVLTHLDRLAILPDPQKSQKNESSDSEIINRAIFSLLPVAAAAFNTLGQEAGETDFTAVAIAAIEALGTPDQPTPLALRLDYRIQHILVDEFQDTSSVQIDLLERLTAGWQPDDGRSLFIVGDGMQSIYGFRKANVSLFIRARCGGIGDIEMTPLNLNANFRSDGQIVDWVNQSFVGLFPAEDNLVQGQVAFQAAAAVNGASNWNIDLKGCTSAIQEAGAIAEDIEQKLLEGEGDLAILVRSRHHLKAVLPALRHRKIQWQAQDIDPLADRMVVMDAHSLTRALCVPADRIAWLSVLRAPWAGLDMADLLRLCEWRPDQSSEEDRGFPAIWCALSEPAAIAGLSHEGAHVANRLHKCFETAFSQLGKQSLRKTVERLWTRLNAADALLEPGDRRDVEDYFDLLERIETGGSVADWMAFERQLNELYSQPESSSTARLQIMTIHKSKGLEFDHVYLPALGKTTRQNDHPLFLWWQREYEDGSEGYLLATRPSQSDKRHADKGQQSLYDYLKAEESERQRQETARLLYVACTRARKSLFLTATLGWDERQEQIKKPSRNSMLAILWEAYKEQFAKGVQPDTQRTPALDEESAAVLDGIRRLDPNRPLANESGPAERQDAATPDNHSYACKYSDNYIARITGDLIHQSLMRIVCEAMIEPAIGHFKNDWLAGTAASGLSTEQQNAILQNLEQMLGTILADETGQWLLNAQHEQSAAELEIDYLDAKGDVQLAIIDRTFIENGTRWVIDYKSSKPREGQSVEQFLRFEAERYRPQMTGYLSLFDSPNKRALLYFPAVAASIEIEHP